MTELQIHHQRREQHIPAACQGNETFSVTQSFKYLILRTANLLPRSTVVSFVP